MTTTTRYSSSRPTTTHATRAEAVAALRAQYPGAVLYEVDGEPGRTLAWEDKAAMEADLSGGGSAVAELVTVR